MTLPSGQLSFSQIRGELTTSAPDGMRAMSLLASKTAPDSVSEFNGYTYASLKTNLIGCWELDETSGTILYNKTGSNNLTLYGTYTLNQSGIPSKSVNFNNGYADSASRIVTGFPVSISYWFNLPAAGRNANVWSNKQTNYTGVYNQHHTVNWVMAFGDGGGFGAGNRSSYTSTVSPPTTSTWYHAVLIATAHGTQTFYVNGSSRPLTYLSGGGASTSFAAGVFSIGYNGSYMNVGQTAVWSRSLTGAEITSLYNSGSGKAYSTW